MCYRIGARLAQCHILAREKLYHHLFSTPGHDTTTIDQLIHDLVLWLTHHSFEELPDALVYYLAEPDSDLEGDLAHLTFLDPWGVQVHIHPLFTIYINTLLAWVKCFLATYGVYPGIYDLLDTPRRDFLAAQLHLRDSTPRRPLLHRFGGPPTIRSEYVALQPHLALPPTRSSVHLSHDTFVLQHDSLSCDQSVPHPDSPTVRLSTRKSVALSVHPMASLSDIPACPSYKQSVHTPVTLSMTRQSTTPPVIPAKRLSDCPSHYDHLYTILPRPSGCPTSSDHTSTIYTHL